MDTDELRGGKCESQIGLKGHLRAPEVTKNFQSYYPLKTYGNASSVSHWVNLGMVIIAWANTMLVTILPRLGWMNPEVSGNDVGDKSWMLVMKVGPQVVVPNGLGDEKVSNIKVVGSLILFKLVYLENSML